MFASVWHIFMLLPAGSIEFFDLFLEILFIITTRDSKGAENRWIRAVARSEGLHRSDNIVVSDFTVFRAQRRMEHSELLTGLSQR